MNSRKYIPDLLKKLKDIKTGSISEKIFVGFDGYIDKIQKAVKTRSTSEVTYYPTLVEFSERIARAAGKSGQVELVTQETKIGGNAPIMANALGHLGVQSVCLGNGGYPVIHPEYENLHPSVTILSLGDPAETNALEFNDGKMILSELSTFRKIDWEYVKKTIGIDTLQKQVNNCTVMALVGWCNPDFATDVWRGILQDLMPGSPPKKLMFFDLADPTKKSIDDLKEVLDVINGFTTYGQVILGINENEALKLYDVLNDAGPEETRNLENIGRFIYSKLSVDGLLIHPVDRCIMIHKKGLINLEGKLVREPKISTGGGDNLNAGFCTGQLLDFSMEESLITGMATSGSYVEKGESPDISAVISYLETW
jgi:hypothetical protein